MGKFNSSLTRVQPVLGALLGNDGDRTSWLPALWRLAANRRRSHAAAAPDSVGPLTTRVIFERPVPPSTAFLRWAVGNSDRLTVPPNFGASGDMARAKRALLFGNNPAAREAVVNEALSEIDRLGGSGSARKWWAFEGFTHVDACFETDECLLFVEGKRTETVSASTRWFAKRNQLWRNVEVAKELAGNRHFGVILGVETESSGSAALTDAAATRDSSYPHLSTPEREEFDRHLIGFVTWSEVIMRFDLPASLLVEQYERFR